MVFFNFVNHVSWNVLYCVVFRKTSLIPNVCFFLKYVYNTTELIFDTDW